MRKLTVLPAAAAQTRPPTERNCLSCSFTNRDLIARFVNIRRRRSSDQTNCRKGRSRDFRPELGSVREMGGD